MKVRTITGLLAALIAVAALVWIDTPLLISLIILFSIIAAHEICHSVHLKNKPMIFVTMVVAGLFPAALEFYKYIPPQLRVPVFPLVMAHVLLLTVLMLTQYERTRFSHIFYSMLASFAIPGALACLVLMRNGVRSETGDAYERTLAVWLIFFTLCSAWLPDVYAYFVGVKFGKHKMCPKISPKKTIEGAAGGLIGSVVTNVGFAVLFNLVILDNHKINLLPVAVISLFLGVVSIIGDLAASVLKRNHGIKDFGKIFPGHGGVMDRFDSLVFVTPTLFALLQVDHSLGLNMLYKAIV